MAMKQIDVEPNQEALAREVLDNSRETTASGSKEAPPGMSPGADSQDALNGSTQTQARDAVSGMQQAQAEAAQSERSLLSANPDQAPTWQEYNAGTPAQQTQQAGQTLGDAGAKYDGPAQNAEMRESLQSALDKSSQQSQNTPSEGSRMAAAQQEAASAPAPSPSTSMEK